MRRESSPENEDTAHLQSGLFRMEYRSYSANAGMPYFNRCIQNGRSLESGDIVQRTIRR